MTSRMERLNHDDGADLVNEVLEQNPAEEQGIREEWDSHVGWHRQENVRGGTQEDGQGKKLRGSSSHITSTKIDQQQDQVQDPPKDLNLLLVDTNNNHNVGWTATTNLFLVGGVMFILVVVVIVRLTNARLRLSRGQKER